jgi:hypothetical protein
MSNTEKVVPEPVELLMLLPPGPCHATVATILPNAVASDRYLSVEESDNRAESRQRPPTDMLLIEASAGNAGAALAVT